MGDAGGALEEDDVESTAATEEEEAEAKEQAQKVVEEFVRTYVRGHTIEVLALSGSSMMCLTTLDRKLTMLSVALTGSKSGRKRDIPLEQVQEILIGVEEAQHEVDLPVDDFCVTL